MALIDLKFRSKTLRTDVSVCVILPEPGYLARTDHPYKTLYLYHGLSDDQYSWLRRSSIERYAAEHHIAVVMPCVGRSWYADTVSGQAYFTFVTKELPQVCRSYFCGMSHRREDTLVAGESMGGYGALKAALQCPDVFGGCASLSGSLDITRRGRIMSDEFLSEWIGNFGVLPAELENTEQDLTMLVRRNRTNGLPFPKLYLWCGTEDHLLQVNRAFHALLEEQTVPHYYEESEGDHSWRWWDLHIQEALRYLLAQPEESDT